MIRAWRIYKPRHAASAFTGEGARRYGGRWNSKGTPLVYTSSSISLAALELLAHLRSIEVLMRYRVREVAIDENFVERIDLVRLPKNWKASPPPPSMRKLGDDWVVAGTSAVLEVPSAIVESESNYLINPRHDDFKHIRIGAEQQFRFDPRLARPR